MDTWLKALVAVTCVVVIAGAAAAGAELYQAKYSHEARTGELLSRINPTQKQLDAYRQH